MLTVHAPNRALRRIIDRQDARDARRRVRELAGSPLSTSSTPISVNAFLRQPRTISRDLVNVILQRGGFLADRLLVRGSADQVAGGSMQYQRSGSSYPDRDPEEIGEDADWPRAGWSEELRQAAVKTYGLEIPISALSQRRNQTDQITRAERRLANAIIKFVDTQAMSLLRTDPDILTLNAANWDDPTSNIIADIANAQEAMDVLDEGIVPSTLVLPKTMRVHFIENDDLRTALMTAAGSESVRTGQVANFLGLENIYFSNQIPDDEALLIDPGIAGTIADEVPDPSEGWSAYDPGPGFPSIYVQTYPEKRPKRTIVAAGRWPAMALVEPRAVLKFTSTTA